MEPEQLSELASVWTIHLEAQGKSPKTIHVYTTGVATFLKWCEQTSTPPLLDQRTVNTWTASMLSRVAPATASARQFALRRFSAWLYEEGEIEQDLLLGIKPPKQPVKVVEPLTDDELRRLLGTCRGKTFQNRRDEAIIRFMIDTGARAEEVLNLEVDDVDIKRGVAVIRRGKGGKGRIVALGARTTQSLERYLRQARRSHPLAHTPALWLGAQGKPRLRYMGLWTMLRRRATDAGINKLRPHVLRNTFASRWLANNGSEQGLMSICGWSRRDMIDRYTRATTAGRAIEEAKKLNLGDL